MERLAKKLIEWLKSKFMSIKKIEKPKKTATIHTKKQKVITLRVTTRRVEKLKIKKPKGPKLIIGLGNPGEEYELTRHNCGFMAAQYLIDKNDFPQFKSSPDLESLISKKGKIIIALPQTFMNNSGRAVRKIKDYYKIDTENILIIHDDVDFSLGKIKLSYNRGSAGHRGIQSIINSLKTKSFSRCRVGISPIRKKIKAEEIVLKKLSKNDQILFADTLKDINNALQPFLK